MSKTYTRVNKREEKYIGPKKKKSRQQFKKTTKLFDLKDTVFFDDEMFDPFEKLKK